MSAYETYREDLPELIRGRLVPARAAEILEAAKHDETLRNALEQERSLERWLDYYEVAEPAQGFEGRFWRRFHEEQLADAASRRSAWLLKLVGPLAAAVLIAIGVIAFVDNGDDEQGGGTDTAQSDGGEKAPAPEVTWDEDEFDYITGVTEPLVEPRRADKLSAEDLELMKALDNAAFLPLDDLDRPEDLAVIDDLDLLTKLAEEDE
ncbi:MAG: hypothetical protein H6841_10955 [Planctomycetes bacterium]|nr:hypothetical protein [Planctomycetota bacterium]MCB9935800.1 hypothetical protein [Planctomycetota bacterium]